MIGYVLLITFAIIMGGIVYTWMKSYVPRQTIECPDGVSIFIKDIECVSADGKYNLKLNLMNNGRFGIKGFYIKYSKEQEQEIATETVSNIISGGQISGGVVFFTGQEDLEPGENNSISFELENKPYLIEITPIRFETIKGKNRKLICGDAKIKEEIYCD